MLRKSVYFCDNLLLTNVANSKLFPSYEAETHNYFRCVQIPVEGLLQSLLPSAVCFVCSDFQEEVMCIVSVTCSHHSADWIIFCCHINIIVQILKQH